MSERFFPDATFPALNAELLDIPSQARLTVPSASTHLPRILMLYGSLRERSYSRLLTFEAARLLFLSLASVFLMPNAWRKSWHYEAMTAAQHLRCVHGHRLGHVDEPRSHDHGAFGVPVRSHHVRRHRSAPALSLDLRDGLAQLHCLWQLRAGHACRCTRT